MYCICSGPGTAADDPSGVRLLFDQNLSPWLCGAWKIASRNPFMFAKLAFVKRPTSRSGTMLFLHEFVIVTKDADFRQRSFLEGFPPKIIWVRLGNCSTKTVEALIRKRISEIHDFLRDGRPSFLGLS